LEYLLSATEYAMPRSFLMLHQTLDELPDLDGIVMYSLFLLPESSAQRDKIMRLAIDANKTLHFAVEDLRVRDVQDLQRIENIWSVAQVLPHCPESVTHG
tara:strand:- start:871 stop:1170 length:300 start_codon:yes stop_codon:yes gene_type:complete